MTAYKIVVNGEAAASVQSEKGDRVTLTFTRPDGNTTSHTLEPEAMSEWPFVILDIERGPAAAEASTDTGDAEEETAPDAGETSNAGPDGQGTGE